MRESDFEELNEINETNPEDEIIDKENVDPLTPILRNLKKRSVKKQTKLRKMWEGWPLSKKLQGTRNLTSGIIN
ncbi:unnamed protein product [Rhizophagus irregularis]|nr:unnamed protein product [Rhizophagus irregularis]